MQRRSFLASILAACAAPAIARSGVLMPIKPAIWVPPTITQVVEHEEPHMPTIKIYSGRQPQSINDPARGMLLAEIPMELSMGLGSFEARGKGIAQALGTAAWFELTRNGKAAMRGSVSVTGGGGDMKLSHGQVVPGQHIHAAINPGSIANR